MMRYWLPDVAATETLGRMLALSRPPRAILHLHGDLGSGKSTLARALLRALGVGGAIRSPTYTLVERYPLADGGEALHLDLYRIADAGELEVLGLDAGEGALWIVEWPERGGASLPTADLRLDLAIDGAGRSVALVPGSVAGQAWLSEVVGQAELRPLSIPG